MERLTRGAALLHAADEGRLVAFRASTPALDRHGSRILPAGIRTESFERNPVFLWGHEGYGRPDPQAVIGRVVRQQKSAEAFDIEVEFAPEAANPRAEQALRLVRAGFLSAVSIGFLPRRSHEEHLADGRRVLVHDEVELLEVSLVPIPSNPEALALVREVAAFAAGPGTTPLSPPLFLAATALRSAFRQAALSSCDDDSCDDDRKAKA